MKKRCYLVRITTQTDLLTFNASESMVANIVRCLAMGMLACYVVFNNVYMGVCVCVCVRGSLKAMLSLQSRLRAATGWGTIVAIRKNHMRVCGASSMKTLNTFRAHLPVHTHTHIHTIGGKLAHIHIKTNTWMLWRKCSCTDGGRGRCAYICARVFVKSETFLVAKPVLK